MHLKYFLLFAFALAGQFSKGRELVAAEEIETSKNNKGGSILGNLSEITYTEVDPDSSEVQEKTDETDIKEESDPDGEPSS